VTPDVNSALAREKQLKGWTRKKKVDLINTVNPKWEDISQGSFDFAQDDRGVSAVREQV
jgi:putative endonuclease